MNCAGTLLTSVIETYSDDPDPYMRQQVTWVLRARGEMHSEQGDRDAAIADYTSIIETYSAAQGQRGGQSLGTVVALLLDPMSPFREGLTTHFPELGP